jgi:hypothetical protein
MVADGTAKITAATSSSASAILLVITIPGGKVISGKRTGSGPFFLSLLASFSVLAQSRTSPSLLQSSSPSVIPQLVVPMTATFCMLFL